MVSFLKELLDPRFCFSFLTPQSLNLLLSHLYPPPHLLGQRPRCLLCARPWGWEGTQTHYQVRCQVSLSLDFVGERRHFTSVLHDPRESLKMGIWAGRGKEGGLPMGEISGGDLFELPDIKAGGAGQPDPGGTLRPVTSWLSVAWCVPSFPEHAPLAALLLFLSGTLSCWALPRVLFCPPPLWRLHPLHPGHSHHSHGFRITWVEDGGEAGSPLQISLLSSGLLWHLTQHTGKRNSLSSTK